MFLRLYLPYSIFHSFFRIFYSIFHLVIFSQRIFFSERTLPWLIHESIKALEIRNFITFNLSFPSSTNVSCFIFFLTIDLYLFNSCSYYTKFYCHFRIVIAIGRITNKANTGIETQPVIIEAKISKFST